MTLRPHRAGADPTPAAPSEPTAITLTSDRMEFAVGQSAELTATVDVDVSGSSSLITITDQTSKTTVAQCSSGTTCVGYTTFATGGPHTYLATVNDLQSASIAVSRQAWATTLTADTPVFAAGSTVTLSVAADQSVSYAGYQLYLFDQTSRAMVQCSWSDSSYSQRVSFATGSPHHYVAVVAAGGCAGGTTLDSVPDLQATSNVITLTRQPWSVALSADTTVFAAGQPATLTISADQSVNPSSYQLYLFDQTTRAMVQCSASNSTYSQHVSFLTGGPHQYVSVVAGGGCAGGTTLDNLVDVQARSNVITLTRQAWSVTLATDLPVFAAGQSPTLLVTADQSVNSYGYQLYLFDQTTRAMVQCSASNSTYSQHVSFLTGGPHQYVSVVAAGGCAGGTTLDNVVDVQARSNVITLTRQAWSVTLDTDTAVFAAGQWSTLTASADQTLNPYGYQLYIFDQTTRAMVQCSASNSTYTQRASFVTGGPHDYVAVVAGGGCAVNTLDTVPDIQATSNVITLARLPWAVGLSLDPSQPSWPNAIWLDVTANQDVGRTDGNFAVVLWDYTTGKLVNYCSSAPCPMRVPIDPGSAPHSYVAYVGFPTFDSYDADHNPNWQVLNIQAASNGFSADTGAGAILPDESNGGSNPAEANCQQCKGDPINTATGEFFDSATDLGLPGSGAGLLVTRTYSSNSAATDGPFGYGWSSNYAAHLSFTGGDTSDPLPRTVQVTQENGSTTEFAEDAHQHYTPPARVQASLSYDASAHQWTYTRRAVESLVFDATGQLTAMRDKFGTALIFGYGVDGHLHTVTATGQRSLTYTWTGSHITGVSDSAGRDVAYSYNPSGELSSVIGVAGTNSSYGYDSARRLTSTTSPGGATTQNSYDSSGRVVAQSDPDQRVTVFGYSGTPLTGSGTTTTTSPAGSQTIDNYSFGRLISETRAAGTSVAATVVYTYDSAANVASVTDPGGNLTTYTHDAQGNIISRVDPLQRTTTWTYDALNDLTSVTDAEQRTATATFDSHGSRLSTLSPAGRLQQWTYNADGTIATAKDAAHKTTQYHYDAAGDLTSVIDRTGKTTEYHYDAAGNLHEVIDPTLKSTVTDYDSSGRPVQVTDADGHVTWTTYDADGHKLTVTDANHLRTTWTYDVAGQLTRVTSPSLAHTDSTYTVDGQLASVTDPNGHPVNYTYDALGDLATSTDADGRATHYLYDGLGRLLSTTLPSGATSSTSYDAAGQPVRSEDANQHVSTSSYDLDGRLVDTTDADQRLTHRTYTDDGELATVTNPDHTIVRYSYADDGGLSDFVDPDLKHTTYSYDDDARLVGSLQPGSLHATYSYDDDGRPSVTTRPGGSTETASYDPAGRLMGLDYSDPATSDISYTYTAAGQLATTHDATGTTSYAYDSAGRPTQVTNGAGASISYGYDLAGQLDTLTYPGQHQMSYGYDDAGQLLSATDWASRQTSFSWTQDGQLASQTTPDGDAETTSYDPAAQATDITLTHNANTLSHFGYSYDPAGQLTADTTTGGTGHSYTYDELAQLNGVTPTDSGTSSSYTQSPAGALTGLPDGSSLGYNTAQQLDTLTPATGPVTSYLYNGNGDRTSSTVASGAAPAGTTHYSYDTASSLTGLTTATGTGINYTSDADGLRQSRAVTPSGGTTTTQQLTWDTVSASVPRLLDDGVHTYLYGPTDTPYAQIADATGSIEYLHTDLVGSVRSTSDSTGALTSTATYDAYGNRTAHTGTVDSSIGFTGNYTDPDTGLIYLRARDYDPTTGQFLTIDPAVDSTHQPYAYAQNDPLQNTDPSGLFCALGHSNGRCRGGGVFDGVLTSGPSNWLANQLQHGITADAVSLLEGVGDGATFGLTARIREAISPGSNCYVQHNGWYFAGKIIGAYAASEIGGAAAGKIIELGAGAIARAVQARRIAEVTKETEAAADSGVPNAVIGKVKDLGSVGDNEYTLLDKLPDQGSPAANWSQNSGVLRQEMSRGVPIRDASVGSDGQLTQYPGSFLNAERNLLTTKGWTYDPKTTLWSPGG